MSDDTNVNPVARGVHYGRPMTMGEIVEAEAGTELERRIAALERRVMELTAERDYSENDTPWREALVQRAIGEIDNPTARHTDIKGRFFRDGMQHMIMWLRQHPEVWKESAEEDG